MPSSSHTESGTFCHEVKAPWSQRLRLPIHTTVICCSPCSPAVQYSYISRINFLHKIRPARQLPATIDKTKYQLQLGAILLFKCPVSACSSSWCFLHKGNTKRSALLYPFHPDRGLSGGGDHQQLSTTCTRLCLNPARVLFINQRWRFGRNIKDSGDSGSTFSPAPFSLYPGWCWWQEPKEQGTFPGDRRHYRLR